MSRIEQSRGHELWNEGSADRVEELRRAIVNDTGGLQDASMASVVGELLARLDGLAEHPSAQMPAPTFPGGTPPDSQKSTAILERLSSRGPELKQGLDAAGGQRVDRMVNVLKFYSELKFELMARADKG